MIVWLSCLLHFCVVSGRAFKCDKGTTCSSLACRVRTMDSALDKLLLMIIMGLLGKPVPRNLFLLLRLYGLNEMLLLACMHTYSTLCLAVHFSLKMVLCSGGSSNLRRGGSFPKCSMSAWKNWKWPRPTLWNPALATRSSTLKKLFHCMRVKVNESRYVQTYSLEFRWIRSAHTVP